MKKDYSEILRDPRWQKKRLEVLQAHGFKCEACENTEETLHVHHRYYVSHRMPWEYPDFCYQVLCVICHDRVKDSIESRRLEDSNVFEEWEAGLDFFGDNIFSLMVDAHEGGADEVKLYAKEISWRERKGLQSKP